MTPQDAAVELAVEQIVVGEESMLDQVWRCTTDQEKNRGIIGLYGTWSQQNYPFKANQ